MNSFDLRQRIAAAPERDQNSPEFAVWLNDLGVACHHSNYTEAEGYYKRALAIWETALGPEHPYMATGWSNLSALFRKLKFFSESERMLQLSLRIRKKNAAFIAGPQDPLEAEHYDPRGILRDYGAD